MYLDHFNLRTDPFPLYPSLKFVFMSTAFEEAMAHLAYGLEHEEDIILITGPIGTGKTLAVQSLLSNLGKLYRTAFVNVTQLDYTEVLKLVLSDLGAPLTGSVDRGDLLAALKEQVRLSRSRGNKILIVVDEAQNLSPETLEGLRLLTNLGQPEGQAVQLVLVGQPDLERHVRLPQLVQLRQRIRVHYRLETLNRQETEAYIAHRLKVAGADRPLFKPKAIDVIHRASAGVPRLVNILCSRALLSAFVDGKREVDAGHVDLEDLPPAAGVADEPAPAAAAAPAPAVATPPPVATRPAPDPTPARAVAPAPAPTPAPNPAPAAQPFEPMAAYRRRERRGGVWFVFVLLLLVLAAIVVFSLQPADAFRHADADQSPNTPFQAETPAASEPAAADSAATQPDAPPPPAGAIPAEIPAAGTLGGGAGAQQTAPATTPVTATAAAPAAALPAPGGWAIHVHSFQDLDRTDADIAKFRRAGYPVFFRTALVEGLEWQRVYVGPYRTIEEAREAEARLRDARLTSYAQVVRLGDGAS